MIVVVYDGWSICYAPNSPAALHLLTLLDARPPAIEPIVLLPAHPPEWFPSEIETRLQPTPNTSTAHLFWEQRTIPKVARQVGARLIHLTSPTPALFTPVPSIISPAGFGRYEQDTQETLSLLGYEPFFHPDSARSFSERLRHSIAAGALGQIAALCWPADLPYLYKNKLPTSVRQIPPSVHPAFLTPQTRTSLINANNLPEEYFLYHGPGDPSTLQVLFSAWSWVAAALGDTCRLCVLGLEDAQHQVGKQITEYDLEDDVKVLPVLSPQELAGVYQGSSGIFHPAPTSIWEGPLRLALSCGKPIVAAQTDLAEGLVGPAAYLVNRLDTRGMGAAIISILVEDSHAAELSQAAQERSAGWQPAYFQEQVSLVYQQVSEKMIGS